MGGTLSSHCTPTRVSSLAHPSVQTSTRTETYLPLPAPSPAGLELRPEEQDSWGGGVAPTDKTHTRGPVDLETDLVHVGRRESGPEGRAPVLTCTRSQGGVAGSGGPYIHSRGKLWGQAEALTGVAPRSPTEEFQALGMRGQQDR